MAGVRAGDVVAVQLPTWYETTVLYLALVHLGAIVLPIVSIYGQAEVEFILRQSKAKLYVSPAQWRKVDYLARHAAFRSLPELRDVLIVGEGAPAGALSWERLSAAATQGVEPVQCDPDAVSLLMYTSGTTSAPKGVQHTHHSLLREWGRPSYRNRGLYLANLPAGHYTGYSYMFRPSIYGAPMIFLDQWDAHFAAEVVQRHKVRAGGGTPIFLFSLLEMAEKHKLDISSLESFSLGGQGMTPALVQLADSHGFPARASTARPSTRRSRVSTLSSLSRSALIPTGSSTKAMTCASWTTQATTCRSGARARFSRVGLRCSSVISTPISIAMPSLPAGG